MSTPRSAFCRNSPSSPWRHAGFTLLELVVVLALLGVVTALALPNLATLYDSVQQASQRDYLLDQLAGLGPRALAEGADLELTVAAAEDADGGAFRLVTLDVPEGWNVELEPPLRARANGVCLGTEASLIHRSGVTFKSRIAPPFCDVER